uniref:ABC transporter domain-containing protein n=1 Tax=Trichuris muris TaxID=70415 RepID=A0A5S6R2S3_TRIMR
MSAVDLPCNQFSKGILAASPSMKKVAESKEVRIKVHKVTTSNSWGVRLFGRRKTTVFRGVKKPEKPKVENPVMSYEQQPVLCRYVAQLGALLRLHWLLHGRSLVLCVLKISVPIIFCYLILHPEHVERSQTSFCYYPPIGMPSSGWLSVLQSQFCSYRRVCLFDRSSDRELGPVDSDVPLSLLLSEIELLLNASTVRQIVAIFSAMADLSSFDVKIYTRGNRSNVNLVDYFAPGCNNRTTPVRALLALGMPGIDEKYCALHATISQSFFLNFAYAMSEAVETNFLSRKQLLDHIDPSNHITKRITKKLLSERHSPLSIADDYVVFPSEPNYCRNPFYRDSLSDFRLPGYYLNERNQTMDQLYRESTLIDAFGNATGFTLSIIDIFKWLGLIKKLRDAVNDVPLFNLAISFYNILSDCQQLLQANVSTTDHLNTLANLICNATYNTVERDVPAVTMWKSNASAMVNECKAETDNNVTAKEDELCFAWIKTLNIPEAERLALYTLLRGRVLLSPSTPMVRQIARKADEKLHQLRELNNLVQNLSVLLQNATQPVVGDVAAWNTQNFKQLLVNMLHLFPLLSKSRDDRKLGIDHKWLNLMALASCLSSDERRVEMGNHIMKVLLPVKLLLGCIHTESRITVVGAEQLRTTANCLISGYNLLSIVEFSQQNKESAELPNSLEYTINVADYLLDSNSSLDEDTDDYHHFTGYNYPYAIVHDMIDEAIMELRGQREEKVGRFLQPFPRKAELQYPSFYPFEHLPFVFSLLLFVTSAHTLWHAAVERRRGISDYMRVTGLRWLPSFLSYIIRSLFSSIPPSLFLLYIAWDMNELTLEAFAAGCTLCPACAMAASSQCYLLYSTFSNFHSLMVAAALVYLLGYFVFLVVLHYFLEIGYAVQMFISIVLPQVAWGFGYASVMACASLEVESWYHILRLRLFANDKYNILSSLMALLMNALINLLLAWLLGLGAINKLRALFAFMPLGRQASRPCKDVELYSDDAFAHESRLLPIGLSVSYVYYGYQGNHALPIMILRNITTDFYEGQITVIFGKELSGKSTLMHLLSGILAPQKGAVLIPGKKGKLVMPTSSDIAYCPEELYLFENLTVREHLKFYRKLRGGKCHSEACRYIAMQTGLVAFLNVKVKVLPVNMKRILQLAVAVICDARVWLIDEPTKGLKPTARRLVWNFLLRHKSARTIIVASSSYEEAETIGDRIAVLCNNRLQYCGSLSFLKNKTNTGYNLKLIKIPFHDKDALTMKAENRWTRDVLTNLLPGTAVPLFSSANVKVALPLVNFRALRRVIRNLEKRLAEFACDSYILSSATLEQVFEKINKMLIVRDDLVSESVSPDEEVGTDSQPVPLQTNAFGVRRNDESSKLVCENKRLRKMAGYKVTVSSQMAALLKRRYLNLIRDKWALFFAVIFPGVLLLMVSKAVHIAKLTGSSVQRDVNNQGDSLAIFLNFTHPTIKNQAVYWEQYLLRMFSERRQRKGLDENFTMLTSLPKGESASQGLGYISKFSSLYSSKVVPEKDFLYDGQKVGIADWLMKNNLPAEPTKWTGGFTGAALANQYHVMNHSLFAAKMLTIHENIQKLLGRANGNDRIREETHQLFYNYSRIMSTLSVGSIVKVWYPKNSCTSLSKSMTIISNAMLCAPLSKKKVKRVEIRTHVGSVNTFQLHRMKRLVEMEKYTEEIWLRNAATFALSTAISSLIAPVVTWAVQSKTAGIKDVMFHLGIRTPVYWISNMIFDVLFYWAAMVLMFPFLLTGCFFPLSPIRLAIVSLLLCCYSFAVVPVAYLLSLPVDSPSKTFKDFLALNFFASMAGFLGVFVQDNCPDNMQTKSIVKCMSWMIPQFHLCDCIVALSTPCKSNVFAQLNDENCFAEFGGLKRSLWAVFFIVLLGIIALILLIAIESPTFIFLLKLYTKNGARFVLRRPAIAQREVEINLRRACSARCRKQEAVRDAAVKGTVLLIQSIQPGECISILGGNGVGKSSILKIAMTMSRAKSIANKSVKEILNSILTPIANGFCYCPQWSALDESLTVKETLDIYATLCGIPRTARCSIVNDFLRSFGMSDFADARSGTISMDLKRRLSIASAIMGPCSVLVLDEPTNTLERQTVNLLHGLLSNCLLDGSFISTLRLSFSFKECELLCQHTAVVTRNTLHTSVPLKELRRNFGIGYLVKIKFEGNYDVQLQTMKRLPTFQTGMMSISRQSLNTFSCQYSVGHRTHMKSLLKFLHSATKNCNIQHCIIRPTSIHDVFTRGLEGNLSGAVMDKEKRGKMETRSERTASTASSQPLAKARNTRKMLPKVSSKRFKAAAISTRRPASPHLQKVKQ